jgi:hypothetical protein
MTERQAPTAVSQAIQRGLLSWTANSLSSGNVGIRSRGWIPKDFDRLTEVDQQISPPLPLADWQSHDTADIEMRTPFLLGEVTDESPCAVVELGHDVE